MNIIEKEVSKMIYDEKSHKFILTIENVNHIHDILCNRILYKYNGRYSIVACLQRVKLLDGNRGDFSAEPFYFYSPDESQVRDIKLNLIGI